MKNILDKAPEIAMLCTVFAVLFALTLFSVSFYKRICLEEREQEIKSVTFRMELDRLVARDDEQKAQIEELRMKIPVLVDLDRRGLKQ